MVWGQGVDTPLVTCAWPILLGDHSLGQHSFKPPLPFLPQGWSIVGSCAPGAFFFFFS